MRVHYGLSCGWFSGACQAWLDLLALRLERGRCFRGSARWLWLGGTSGESSIRCYTAFAGAKGDYVWGGLLVRVHYVVTLLSRERKATMFGEGLLARVHYICDAFAERKATMEELLVRVHYVAGNRFAGRHAHAARCFA